MNQKECLIIETFFGLHRTEMCELFVRKTDEGTLLHICSFPEVDVHLFVEIHLEVGERGTNTSLYNRTVCVEDHCEKSFSKSKI